MTDETRSAESGASDSEMAALGACHRSIFILAQREALTFSGEEELAEGDEDVDAVSETGANYGEKRAP